MNELGCWLTFHMSVNKHFGMPSIPLQSRLLLRTAVYIIYARIAKPERRPDQSHCKKRGRDSFEFLCRLYRQHLHSKAQVFQLIHKTEIDSLVKQGYQPDYAIMMVAEKSFRTGKMLPPVSLLIDHLDYIVKLVGVDHVGIGSDFDGIEAPPKEMKGVRFPANH